MAEQAVTLLKELRSAIDDITVVDSTSGARTSSREQPEDLNGSIGFVIEKVDNFLNDSYEIQIIQVSCPSCKTEYDIADNLVGRNAVCQNCQKEFTAEPEHKKPFTKTILFQDSDTIKLLKSEYERSQTKWWKFWK